MGFTIVFTPVGGTSPDDNITVTGVRNISIAQQDDRKQPASIIVGGGVGGGGIFPAGGGVIPITQVVSIAVS